MRVTITQGPNSDYAHVAVSVKGAGSRWDEWNLLLPAVRVEMPGVTGATDVLAVLRDVAEHLRENF